MTTLKLNRSFYALDELPELVSIPSTVAVEQAIQGNLDLIVSVPANTRVWSMHRDAIDMGSSVHQYRRLTGSAKTISADETAPMSMDSSEILGLALTRDTCFNLLRHGHCNTGIFARAMRVRGGWAEFVDPIPRNAFCKNARHDVAGWVLGCYPNNLSIVFDKTLGYPKPYEVEIRFDTVRVSNTSIDKLLELIEKRNISRDLFSMKDEAYVGISKETIAAVSDRFAYLLEILCLCWPDPQTPLPQQDVQDRIEVVINQLQVEDFVSLLDTGEPGKGLLKAVEKVVTPVFARKNSSHREQALYPTFVTPELVALLTTWKVFWDRPTINLNVPATLPNREHEIAFLKQHFGFTHKDAEALTPLLRPSSARKGRPFRRRRPSWAPSTPIA